MRVPMGLNGVCVGQSIRAWRMVKWVAQSVRVVHKMADPLGKLREPSVLLR